jgi:hypothetical protein
VAKENRCCLEGHYCHVPNLERSEPDWRYSAAALQIRIFAMPSTFLLSSFYFSVTSRIVLLPRISRTSRRFTAN